jgi:probable F420-dependent oxidoreductase
VRLGITCFLTDRDMAPAELARAAEERGFTSLYLPEHTHLPVRADTPPSLVEGVRAEDYTRSLDPFVALATAASVTTTLTLGTGVVLVAQHDPIVLAKQVATLDHLSGGRVVLGIGFGWNREEAADHGVAFGDRRAIAREHVLCMQALWRDDPAEYHGEFVDLDPCWSRPKPVQQPGVPVLLGGAPTAGNFAAVAEYADGWMPIGGSGLGEALPRLRRAFGDAGRDPDLVRVIPFGTVPTEAKLAHFESLGLDEVVLRVPSGSRTEILEVLDAHAVHVARFAGTHG